MLLAADQTIRLHPQDDVVIARLEIAGPGFLNITTGDQIAEIRKYYGDVYPSVQDGRSARTPRKRSQRKSGR
jgi:hypothetical protein